MSRDAGIDDWIEDFLNSDDPALSSKTKQKRKEMAIAAYYQAKKKKRQ